jgi:hypothetical protein
MVPETLTFLRLHSHGVTQGDPLGTLLELTYARLRNLLPLLEEKAQHPSFRHIVHGLITNPHLSALPPVQAQRLVGLLMAPPPQLDYLGFRAYLADASLNPWLETMGRRMLAYSLEMQEKDPSPQPRERRLKRARKKILRAMRATWVYQLAAKVYLRYCPSS